ncbi:cellulose synthase A catalytic subunit 4 [UDP-forming]-like [Macadamia integrifolia]|uniref:cellulose synthase A catalytic subunit 4 [UDP-forming]-like n=1 Tax=Macadamia integrifolia TaxID=60698 RepID=UPI001C4E7078|nr:cellulose synthase A catalytic subunit 4 [UDP-forming]-like [Macadamia integrifolia]
MASANMPTMTSLVAGSEGRNELDVLHGNAEENEDYNQQQQQQPNKPAFASVAWNTVGKDYEGDKDLDNTDQWKEREEKWRARKEKRGLVSKDDRGGNDQGEENDYR